MRKRRCGESLGLVGGRDDGSSDDGGMGGSSSLAASASGLPNGSSLCIASDTNADHNASAANESRAGILHHALLLILNRGR